MMDPTDRQTASRGFTVVELLVALGLAAVVFGLIVSFFANMSRSTTTQNAAAAAQQTARAGVDFMAQELRLAGLDPLNSAGAGIEADLVRRHQDPFHVRQLRCADRRQRHLR